jgi:hypothetical protein
MARVRQRSDENAHLIAGITAGCAGCSIPSKAGVITKLGRACAEAEQLPRANSVRQVVAVPELFRTVAGCHPFASR